MRRIPTLLAAGGLFLLAACGDNVLTGATSTSTTESTATSLPPTTTTSTSSTTTTLPPTATTVESDAFDSESGTPPGELDSFTGTSEMTFTVTGIDTTMTTDATYVGSAFECVSSVDTLGIVMTMTVVATPEMVWIDRGNGFEESNLFDSDVQGVTGLCPASPLFWSGFGETPWAAVSGEPDTINGVAAQRVDLSGVMGDADFVDLAAVFGYGYFPEGVGFSEMVFWIADPGGWPVAVNLQMDLSEEALAELVGMEGLGTGTISIDVEIDNVNDPSLSIEVPPG